MSRKHAFLSFFAKITLFACVFCAFFISPVFATLPAGYTELEYIESTGTQWIDTGYKKYTAGHNYRIVSSVWFADVTTRQVQGCQDYFYFGVINGYWQFAQGTTGHVAQRPNTQTWYDIDALFDTANNLCNYSINEESFTLNLPPNPYLNNHNGDAFAVFSLNNNTLPFGNARVKNYALYDNNTLVRNFIPAKRNSDSTIGMYDTVTNTFFINKGTEDFIAGPVAEIKIATTKMVDEEFAAAEANLAATVQTIESVVSRTIAQTEQIQMLQDTKQTRPDESCPANMKCLLVQDEDGTPHWYPIIEP